ncbi:MAG: SLBB domain-containing protein [Opitutaceae bacterium]|nr:SLBB domain-containing protein [Opitutaceae bacterium]
MRPRFCHCLACLGAAALLLAGCRGPRFDARAPAAPATGFAVLPTTGTIPPEWLQPPTEPFRLGIGDRVEVEILEVGGTRQVCTVMPDGLIYFNLLHGLKVEGLTLEETRHRLQQELAAHYRAPQVGLILRRVNSQRVWIMGRVNTPGLYPLTQPTTVVEAIARAGGLFASRFSGTTEELADLRHSFFVRDGKFVPVDFHRLLREGDMTQNLYLRNGDYLFLPSALSKQIYVLGAVNAPRAVGFMDQVTLLSAIANARDLRADALADRVLIIRGSLTAPQVAVVDYAAIRHGRAPDVVLEPSDIVWVPESAWHDLGEYAKLVVGTFVRTVAANEGARAAVKDPATVGIGINVGK